LGEEARLKVCDLLQMVDFCSWFYKCGVRVFVHEEHEGSMVVAYGEGEDCDDCESLVVSFGRGGD